MIINRITTFEGQYFVSILIFVTSLDMLMFWCFKQDQGHKFRSRIESLTLQSVDHFLIFRLGH
jgi:hypothetical protein